MECELHKGKDLLAVTETGTCSLCHQSTTNVTGYRCFVCGAAYDLNGVLVGAQGDNA